MQNVKNRKKLIKNYIEKMKKHTYNQPLAEIFELNLQRNVLQGVSPDNPQAGKAGADNTYNTYDEDF